MHKWLTQFLFFSRQTRPDGRPLYAYKMSERTYAELKELTRQQIQTDRRRGLVADLEPLFCLYAAETFCREHSEGPWAWRTVFTHLGLEEPEHSVIADWVEKGLRFWRRKLLHDSRGRLFLMTLACEGGLPLRLLERESTHLTHYFRSVLEHYYRFDQSDQSLAEAIACQQAHRLPATLRQPPVFHLAGTLVAKVKELQSHVGSAADPIAALDRQDPNWRRDLPLRLDDQIALSLLTGLVNRSAELAREATARLRWRGYLRATGDDWSVEKVLELPEAPTSEHLESWIVGQASHRPRWRLLLNTAQGSEPVAWLTLMQGESASAHYRREWLRRGGVVLRGAAVVERHGLSLHDGTQEHPLVVRDGEPWGDAPWVFVARGDGARLDWLTEGSARTRAAQVWVLAPSDVTPNAEKGRCECLGRIDVLDRVLFCVQGQVDFLTPQQDRYRIQCQAESDSDWSFCVVGQTVAAALDERPRYQGLPRIECLNADGRREASPTDRLQWRHRGVNGSWSDARLTAQGCVWVRLVRADGVERCRRLVDVVPSDFRAQATIGTTDRAGQLVLSGLGKGRVSLGIDRPTGVTIEGTEDQALVLCPALTGVLPPLVLRVHWPGSEPIMLTLPYPQRGAFFRLVGRPLPDDDWVPLDRLGGLHAFIQDTAGGCRYRLQGSFLTHDLSGQPWAPLGQLRQLMTDGHRCFSTQLAPLDHGRLEIPLSTWRDRVASFLASSADLDAQVRLSIISSRGDQLASVRVSRFDVVMEPNRESCSVRIPEESQDRLGAGWETRARFEMLRLWAPAAESVELQPDPSQAASWTIPAELESGPWWVIGYDGEWARFRPMLWVVPAREGDTPAVEASPLAAAILEPHPERRQQALGLALMGLAEDPDHSDWALLLEYLRLAQEFPPSALDVLCVLVTHPRTLAQALMRADAQTFETIWALSRHLPFLWTLVPVDDWLAAAERYYEGLRQSLCQIDSGEDILFDLFQAFRGRAGEHRLYWLPLCDWMQRSLFRGRGRPLPPDSMLKVARSAPGILEAQIEPAILELQGRHDANERWPDGQEVKERIGGLPPWVAPHLSPQPAYSLAVRSAPFVAAHLSLQGLHASPSLILELRLLRAFDRDWFDLIHAIAMTIGLAQRSSES
ncbi:STY4851/ECs_5259 family protein [Thiorhodococcus minor]|uniref:Uncharacterized protein n=1 Tax=Thiorhodococcus minor TaxID=57489 RepID=A0A6M0JW05_9GAMM|nr:hypothetical protein [Thiorhodococcus minor]